jgi:hypothetical protein
MKAAIVFLICFVSLALNTNTCVFSEYSLIVFGTGNDEIVCEDSVAFGSTLGVLLLGFLWACASLLPLCVGWDALLLRTDTAHRSNFRRMLAHSFPVIQEIVDMFAWISTPL